MTTPEQREENKRAVEQVRDVWASGDVDALDDVMAEDVVARVPGIGDPVRGREAYKETITMYRSAFPDFDPETHDLIAEGDDVAMHYTVRGTHKGELMGIEPTEETFEVSGTTLFRFEDGTVVEETNVGDMLGLFQQLGVVEPPGE